MLGRLLVIAAIVSGAILTILLNITTPANAGAFGILTVFVFGYALVLSFLTFLIYGLFRGFIFMASIVTGRKSTRIMSLRKAYYYSTVLAIVPVIIISMQSVGGVGLYELLLIGLFVAIGCVYVTKRTA